MYGFKKGADESAIKHNRALYLELKEDSAFVFQVRLTLSAVDRAHQCEKSRGESIDEHTGIYMSPAIQQVIDGVLFKPKTGSGIRWIKDYKPFPIPGFALALTAVRLDSYKGYTTHYINRSSVRSMSGSRENAR